MSYTEDREVFERDLFKPPHLARMLEHAGRYTCALDPDDREFILARALDNFWELREQIKQSSDVQAVWDRALRRAARTRQYWKVWWSLTEYRWIKGIFLGSN